MKYFWPLYIFLYLFEEFMVITGNGKNVKFYNTDTLKATYTIELPDSDISDAEYKVSMLILVMQTIKWVCWF